MPAQIVDGAIIAAQSFTGDVGDPRSYLLACYPKATIAPISHVAETAQPMVARINHGRWIASCSCGAKGTPTPGTLVFLAYALGWCVRCGNQAWGGGWRRVAVPPPDVLAQIDAVLSCRPNVGDRNWEPHETVADLISQNLENGDPVPDLSVGPEHGPGWREIVAPLPARAGQLLRAMRRRRWLGRG